MPALPVPPAPPAPPRSIRIAAGVAAVEGAALVGLALVLGYETATLRPTSYPAALTGVALAAAAGALLLRLAWGLARLQGWVRGPLLVLQIIGWPVGYTLAVQAGRPAYGVPILVLTVVCAGALLTASTRAALTGR